jgi:hypothetical protein
MVKKKLQNGLIFYFLQHYLLCQNKYHFVFLQVTDQLFKSIKKSFTRMVGSQSTLQRPLRGEI